MSNFDFNQTGNTDKSSATEMQNQGDSMQEGIVEQRPSALFKMSDKKLITVADQWIHEAKPLHDLFLKRQRRNEQYFLGNQLDWKKMGKYKAKIVLNKIWQSLETVIPRATRNLPAPMVSLPPQEETGKEIDSYKYADGLERTLLAIAIEQELPVKFKELIRFQELFYLGVFKFGFDHDTKKIWVENIRPQRIMVPPNDSDDYVIEYHEDTLKDLIKKFPKKEKQLNEMVHQSPKKTDIQLGTKIGYYEVTTDDFKYWKVHNLMLEKVQNPHYNFKNEKKNHWCTPKKDYIFTDLWTLGLSHFSQTTLVDQVIPLQDSINKRKRQISDNADIANGILVGYGDAGITKKEIASIQAMRERPNGAVYTRAAPGSIQHFQGQLLQPYIFEDMMQTISEIDNIFGTHSTTRGEKTPGEETFGGRQLLKESDQERIDELTQMVERIAEKLYNAFAQMIRIHFKEKQYITYIGEDGTSVQLQIDSKLIKEGLDVKVRQGSTLIKDKSTLSAEAIQLWTMNAIDPVTLYEKIGAPNPMKAAERLFLWQQAPQQLFERVSSELEKGTKSARAQEAMMGVMQAEMENKALMDGENVPPYPKANEQHIAAHQDFWGSDEAQQVDNQIANRAADHIEAELEIVRANLETRKEEELAEPNIGEMMQAQPPVNA